MCSPSPLQIDVVVYVLLEFFDNDICPAPNLYSWYVIFVYQFVGFVFAYVQIFLQLLRGH